MDKEQDKKAYAHAERPTCIWNDVSNIPGCHAKVKLTHREHRERWERNGNTKCSRLHLWHQRSFQWPWHEHRFKKDCPCAKLDYRTWWCGTVPEITSEYGKMRRDDKAWTTCVSEHIALALSRQSRKSHHYDGIRQRIVTPEMEYVAIRENMNCKELGVETFITPNLFVDEIAAGRAVLPANINHPESWTDDYRPQLLVKINTNIGNSTPLLL